MMHEIAKKAAYASSHSEFVLVRGGTLRPVMKKASTSKILIQRPQRETMKETSKCRLLLSVVETVVSAGQDVTSHGLFVWTLGESKQQLTVFQVLKRLPNASGDMTVGEAEDGERVITVLFCDLHPYMHVYA